MEGDAGSPALEPRLAQPLLLLSNLFLLSSPALHFLPAIPIEFCFGGPGPRNPLSLLYLSVPPRGVVQSHASRVSSSSFSSSSFGAPSLPASHQAALLGLHHCTQQHVAAQLSVASRAARSRHPDLSQHHRSGCTGCRQWRCKACTWAPWREATPAGVMAGKLPPAQLSVTGRQTLVCEAGPPRHPAAGRPPGSSTASQSFERSCLEPCPPTFLCWQGVCRPKAAGSPSNCGRPYPGARRRLPAPILRRRSGWRQRDYMLYMLHYSLFMVNH